MGQARPQKPALLAVGVCQKWQDVLRSLDSNCEIVDIAYNDAVLEGALREDIGIVLCGVPPEGLKIIEVGQTMRMFYPNAVIFYVVDSRAQFERKLTIKNGFDDAYLFPFDQEEFSLQLTTTLAHLNSEKLYRRVQLDDVKPDAVLGFDLYVHLPRNNRKVRYVSADSTLSDKKIQKLAEHQIKDCFVDQKDMLQFYEFSARNTLNKISATEKHERCLKAIREALTNIFAPSSEGNMEHGRQLVTDFQDIVKNYICLDDDDTQYRERLLQLAPLIETSVYHQAMRVSRLASLLSHALQVGNSKDFALAGLLHDVGLAEVAHEILLKTDRSPQEAEKYKSHPTFSINLVKHQKMILADNVLNMIEHHHERVDGSGYPAKPNRLKPEAQVMGIAVALNELMSPMGRSPGRTFAFAVKILCEKNSEFDPALTSKLKALAA